MPICLLKPVISALNLSPVDWSLSRLALTFLSLLEKPAPIDSIMIDGRAREAAVILRARVASGWLSKRPMMPVVAAAPKRDVPMILCTLLTISLVVLIIFNSPLVVVGIL